MAFPRFPRLEELLGARLDALEEAHLRAVIDRAATSPVQEDADLDFKRELYANSEDGRRSLAQDVAALANTRGGVILLGVDENAQGAAAAITPVELSDAEDRRIRQVVAGLVAPVPEIQVRHISVGGTATAGVLAIGVVRSAWAPHAVRVNEALRYYRRDGARNRMLAENEVAVAYRDRLTSVQAQIDRLGRVDAEGRSKLDPEGVWLTLALIPNIPGSMPILHRTLGAVRDWSQRFARRNVGDGPLDRQPEVGVAVHRVTLRTRPDSPVKGSYAELYDDGSGFAAREVFPRIGRPENSERRLLSDETLVLTMSGLLAMLSDHALRTAGASGDCAARSTLHGNHSTRGQLSPPVVLGHYRFHGTPEEWSNTQPLIVPIQSDRTLNLEATATSNPQRVVATRELLTDHFQAFGLAEVPQIDPHGRLRSQYWQNAVPPRGWNGRVGVPESSLRMDDEDPAG